MSQESKKTGWVDGVFKTKIKLKKTIQRALNLNLEQLQGGAHVPILLADILPEEIKNKRGTFKIKIEFTPDKS